MQSVRDKTQPLTISWKKLLFGGYFYPYQVALWLCVSGCNIYMFIQKDRALFDLLFGFSLASVIWGLVEYSMHRYVLHILFSSHHNKHHVYPLKMSFIHTPAILVIFKALFHLAYIRYLFDVNLFFGFIPLYYLSFEITHLITHSYNGSNSLLLNAKCFHKLHHIDKNTNYGFTTPFWDYMFGTLSSKYTISFLELLFGFIPFYSFCIHTPNNAEFIPFR